MAHEILTVKLQELDGRIAAIRRRIQIGETADHAQICEELTGLREELAENDRLLRSRLRLSKAESIQRLAKAYEELVKAFALMRTEPLHGARAENENAAVSGKTAEMQTEEKLLSAEYALDFAMMAVDQALYDALAAIDAQLTQEERREGIA